MLTLRTPNPKKKCADASGIKALAQKVQPTQRCLWIAPANLKHGKLFDACGEKRYNEYVDKIGKELEGTNCKFIDSRKFNCSTSGKNGGQKLEPLTPDEPDGLHFAGRGKCWAEQTANLIKNGAPASTIAAPQSPTPAQATTAQEQTPQKNETRPSRQGLRVLFSTK